MTLIDIVVTITLMTIYLRRRNIMKLLDVAAIFKVLGDPTRLEIIQILSDDKERCACELLETFNITQPTLSHHMKILNNFKLIKTRKAGVWNYYTLNKKTVMEFKHFIDKLCDKNSGDGDDV